MSPEIRLSIAIVSRNRPDCLRRCLASVRAQSSQPFEIVISDDSDTATAAEIRGVAEEFRARYVAGPRRGLYANRNACALACEGTHVRTMDDDHTLPAGHFAQCLNSVATDPGALWTTGEVSFAEGKVHDRTEHASQLHPAGVGGPVSNPDDNWAIADGATIYPASVFRHGHRMLEAFAYGSSYLEFGAYLYRAGYRSRCVPGALVEHHFQPETLGRMHQFKHAESCLFASLCYSLHFRRNRFRACRHAAAWLVRNPRLAGSLPKLRRLARERWSVIDRTL